MKCGIYISVISSLVLYSCCGCFSNSDKDPMDVDEKVITSKNNFKTRFYEDSTVTEEPMEVRQSPQSSSAPKAIKSRSVRDISSDDVRSHIDELRADYIAHKDAYEISLSGFMSNIITYDVISLGDGDERVIFSDTIYAAGSPIRWMLPISIDKNTLSYIAVTTKDRRWTVGLVNKP